MFEIGQRVYVKTGKYRGLCGAVVAGPYNGVYSDVVEVVPDGCVGGGRCVIEVAYLDSESITLALSREEARLILLAIECRAEITRTHPSRYTNLDQSGDYDELIAKLRSLGVRL